MTHYTQSLGPLSEGELQTVQEKLEDMQQSGCLCQVKQNGDGEYVFSAPTPEDFRLGIRAIRRADINVSPQ